MPLSKIKTNSIADDAVTTDQIADTSVRGRRNLVINGSMQVNQRNSSVTATGGYNTDRFKLEKSGGTCTYSWESLSSGSPYDEGFRNFSRLTNNATTSGANDYRQLRHTIEAQDVAKSGWDYTSSTSYISISFWVRVSLAGKYTFTLLTEDGTDQSFNYSRTLVANTWTKVTQTVPGNSNLQFDNDSGSGIHIHWRAWLGSTYTNATSEDAWVTYSASVISESGIANWGGTSGATYDLTGVQLEVNDKVTPFEHIPYGEELNLCRRYYRDHFPPVFSGVTNGTTSIARNTTYFDPPMRVAPAVTFVGTINVYSGSHATNFDPGDVGNQWKNDQFHQFDATTNATIQDGNGQPCVAYHSGSGGATDRTSYGMKFEADF